jgi:hypothetical protein
MKSAMVGTACLVSALLVGASALGQDLRPKQVYRGWFSKDSSTIDSERPTGATSGDGPETVAAPPESSKGVSSPARASFVSGSGRVTSSSLSSDMQPLNDCKCTSPGCGLHWSHCFPRNNCPDDYQPKPLPHLCLPSYPAYYRCVPAGDGSGPTCGCPGKNRLPWWLIPTSRPLHESL